MRVGLDLTSGIAHLRTGMLNLTRGLIRGLSGRGDVEVRLFVTAENREPLSDLRSENVRLTSITAEALERELAKVDVIHFPFNEMPLAPRDTASVVTIHDLIPERFPEGFPEAARQKLRRASQRATLVVVDSECTGRDLQRCYRLAEPRIHTVYGCLEGGFEPDDARSLAAWVGFYYNLPKQFIFYPAAYREHKNHRTLLEALAELPEDVHLVLTTGESHLPKRQQELRELVTASSVADRVHVLGHVERHHYPVLHLLARAVVIPSLAEGFGFPVLEAFAMETPVACSGRMSLGEIAAGAVLSFNPEDRWSVAEAIRRVVSDEKLRSSLVAKGRERAKRFSRDASAGQLVSAYSKAVERHRDISRSGKRVAFDVARLAQVRRLHLRPTGITQYTQQLYDGLGSEAELELRPVVFQAAAGEAQQELEEVLASPDFLGVERSWRSEAGALETIPFAGQAGWPLYHSPVNPLPPKELTGNAKRILTVHDCIFVKHPEFWTGTGRPPIAQALDSLGRDDFAICDSQTTREDLHQLVDLARSQTTVIPLAPKPVFREPQRQRACKCLNQIGARPGRYVLALAQPEPRKNIAALVEAFGKLRRYREMRNRQLVLISPSSGSRQQLIEDLKKRELGTEGVLHLVDIDDSTLASLYAQAGLFAYPSFYEGFGLPVLEAMAAGCPVVVSSSSCLPQVAGDAAEYCDPGDVYSLLTGMVNVLINGDYREELIARGRRRARLFTWRKTLREHLRFYSYALDYSVADEGPAPAIRAESSSEQTTDVRGRTGGR